MLLEVIDDSDLRDFAEFAGWMGMLKSEIASLKWGSYDRRAKTISGRKTDSTFRRYDITSTEDIADALNRTADSVRNSG